MRRLLGALLALVIWSLPALAADQGFVVTTCGTLPNIYVAGAPQNMTIDVNGNLCTGATFTPSGTQNINVLQWGTVTLGAATAWGTAPTGNVPGVNANILGPLGQQLATASLPVVLTAAQLSTLTPPAAITGFATQTTLAAILAAQGASPAQQTGAVVGQVSQYPSGATAITASATGTTGATTATLAGTSGKTTYICGYSIRANATAATTVTNTITGVITATLSSIMWVAPAASGIGVDEQIFSPCIPASATNTGIAIVSGAPGTGGNVSSKGWGYQL